ncbi:unnamed protein product [Chrysodeixis includens]|uniref:Uncharacterized protein n=1 Tax=Chrysodeixis includens TaxID=689277 RepID=A0A9N8PYL5_CHRIL|nr:unnamed protein product [Chrysodeixis includens]
MLGVILLVQLIYQLRNVGSSYFGDTRSARYQDSQSQEMKDYGSEQRHHHHHHKGHSGHHHKKAHEHDHDHEHVFDRGFAIRSRYSSSDESDDCDCACNKCDEPSDCCDSMCKNSCPDPRRGSQSSLVFVPYPYPMIVPNPILPKPQPPPQPHPQPEPPPTTTPEATTGTTSTEPPTQRLYLKSQNDNNMLDTVLKSVVDDYSNIIVKTPDKLKNGSNKYMLTSLRRTKPTWMPKFGIVPISDNMAEKLMSQLRSMKGLSRRSKRATDYYEKF